MGNTCALVTTKLIAHDRFWTSVLGRRQALFEGALREQLLQEQRNKEATEEIEENTIGFGLYYRFSRDWLNPVLLTKNGTRIWKMRNTAAQPQTRMKMSD